MDDQTKVTLAAAVVGGYVLGRTKKGRLALTVATYMAGRRFGLGPRQLAAEGMRRLGEIPEVAQVRDQLRGDVLDAGRQAVSAAADRGMNSLADAVGDRTDRLREARGESEEPGEEDREPDEQNEEPDEEDEEPDQEDEEPDEEDESEDEGPARGKAPAASQRNSTGTAAAGKAAAKETPKAKKAVPERKKAVKSAASPKESAARNAARAKKTAARKTASPTRAASGRPDRRR